MRGILIFAGTTEGRELSEILAASQIPHTVSVATEYGEKLLKPHPLRRVHCGRMNQEEIRKFIIKGDFKAVIDATHPYAQEITENIRHVMGELDIPYLCLRRENGMEDTQEKVRYFDSNEDCAKALEETQGNILLTTGTRALPKYCASEQVKSRLYVRVLPCAESICSCTQQGLAGRQLIAMQGPFSAEMNEAILRQYKISCIVSKESGRQGGFQEKLEAAKKAGIQTFVIGRPKEEPGDSFEQLCEKLGRICGKPLGFCRFLWITLAGMGMGDEVNLTREAEAAIAEADVLMGAKRVIDSCGQCTEKKPFYQAGQIIPYLKELQNNGKGHTHIKAVILFSGDSSFYSGCQSVYQALKHEVEEGGLKASVRILPGISSISYLAAAVGESYEGAAIYSMHGKKLSNLARKIQENEKTFLLTSGVKDINYLGRLLREAGMEECQVTAGYQLSYENQQIKRLTPEECCRIKEEGLYTCMIKNPKPIPVCLTPNLSDSQLIRGQVPMTKEEIRQVSICKLRLHKGAVVYDIGSGTGSVAVEIARLSDEMQVYALERKQEAAALICKNKAKFGLDNITVTETEAPDGLEQLPEATHAFIGGSGGRLEEIIAALYHINPHMRVVINAVTVETICKIKKISELYPMKNQETVQVQVSRAGKAGRYHLMQAENPVWINAFDFCENVLTGKR